MEEPTPVPPSAELPSADLLRSASFPQAFKGYDRDAVHAFLDRVAEWMEHGAAGIQQAGPDVRRELERVGERTAGILTAAEEAASKLRAEASDYAASLKETADEELRKATADANRKAEELVAQAESKAERIVDEAIARRRGLNQAISSLVERRDEIAEEVQRLADELLSAVDGLRAEENAPDEAQAPAATGRFASEESDETGEPTELVPPEEHETAVHRAS
jgi:DivIVA domain-containing protein